MFIYLQFLAIAFLLFIPFSYMISFVSNFVQIPFAALGKYPPLLVIGFRNYLLILLFNFIIHDFVSKGALSVVLLIISSLILYFFLASEAHRLKGIRDDQAYYLYILLLLSIIALWVMYFTHFFGLHFLVDWYFSLFAWLETLPVIGWILHAISGAGIVAFIFTLLIVVLFIIAKVIKVKKNY